MKALVSSLLTLSLLAAATPAGSAVNVDRSGTENPMVEVARSTIYGGVTGLLLGGALALAVPDNKDSDYLKWGFVAGTFFGFGYGLHHIATRPSPQALLELDHGALGWGVPEVAVGPQGLRTSLVRARF